MDYTKSGVLIRDGLFHKRHVSLFKEEPAAELQSRKVVFGKVIFDSMETELMNLTNEWFNATTATESPGNETLRAGFDSGYVPYIDRPETYIVPVLFAIIFIIGLVGNGSLILIFLRYRTMRNVPNMYICSLAVGDILVIFFCVPFTSTVYTVESWPYGLLVCKFSEFIKDVSIGVSVFTLTALSADRYFAIVDPMKKLTGCRATRITCVTIAGIWIVSVLIALPSVLFSYVRIIDEDPSHTFKVCYPFPPELTTAYPKVIVMFKFLVYYAIPLVFIASFYIVMARHLVLSTQNMPGEAQGQGKQIQARKKVAKMILSFVVIFALCFFPSHVFLLWFYFDPNSEENFNAFWNFVRIIGFCLGFINSCINPITLYCLSGTFRKYFNKSLICCGRKAEMDRGIIRGGRNILACGANGCVSMSNSAHHIYGDRVNGGGADYRGQNGVRVGTVGGLYRGSAATTNYSLNSNYRRKCTWESPKENSPHQIMMTNLNVSALNNATTRHVTTPNYPLACISLSAETPVGVRPESAASVESTPRVALRSSPKASAESSPNRVLHVPASGDEVSVVEVEEITMTTFIITPKTLENGNNDAVEGPVPEPTPESEPVVES